ncbi:MAG TPA: response regulator, partial [Deltaproteobacteria bacterium]|nr:response regulator [Deltaproteobacteria bacterium]
RGGKEVIRDLMALDPQVRAIVSSGYSNDPIMSNCTEYGFKGVVRKPFKMEDLRDVLQEVLKT